VTAIDASDAGDDAVAGNDLVLHPEIATAMGDELVDLLERPGIEQQIDALARGQLAGFMLPAETIVATPQRGAALEIFEVLECVHQADPAGRTLSPHPARRSE
jgi:hypothetical protein